MLSPTIVFKTYWRFAVERQLMFFRKLRGDSKVTLDPILAEYRFTNAYRAADRTTQYLISVVQAKSASVEDAIFRTLLFKIFNKIETWQTLETNLGSSPALSTFSVITYAAALKRQLDLGNAVYSNAYIMPNPNLGQPRKYLNHLALLEYLIASRSLKRLSNATTLQGLFNELIQCQSFGKFLAFQYAIDINYISELCFDEMSFVVAGPGAINGIRKCFLTLVASPEDVIKIVCENSDEMFSSLNLTFETLWGRKLRLIDCQNLFCEVDKYSRIAHPEFSVGGRVRIKQRFAQNNIPLSTIKFPEPWAIDTLDVPNVSSLCQQSRSSEDEFKS